jgi:hypothetical protein
VNCRREGEGSAGSETSVSGEDLLIERAIAVNTTTIRITFTLNVTRASAEVPGHYTVYGPPDDPVYFTVTSVALIEPNVVELTLGEGMTPNLPYIVEVRNLRVDRSHALSDLFAFTGFATVAYREEEYPIVVQPYLLARTLTTTVTYSSQSSGGVAGEAGHRAHLHLPAAGITALSRVSSVKWVFSAPILKNSVSAVSACHRQ